MLNSRDSKDFFYVKSIKEGIESKFLNSSVKLNSTVYLHFKKDPITIEVVENNFGYSAKIHTKNRSYVKDWDIKNCGIWALSRYIADRKYIGYLR